MVVLVACQRLFADWFVLSDYLVGLDMRIVVCLYSFGITLWGCCLNVGLVNSVAMWCIARLFLRFT